VTALRTLNKQLDTFWNKNMKLKLSTNNSFYPKAVAGIPIAHNLFGDFSYGKTRHFSPHFDA